MISLGGSMFLRNFTELGFQIVKAPPHLQEKLRLKLERGLKEG